MLDEKSQKELGGQVRTLQIVILSLCMGIMCFGGFVLFGGANAKPAKTNMITMLALCAAPLAAVTSLILTRVIVAVHRKKIANGSWQPANKQGPAPATDAGKLAAVYQLKTIIGAALFEGPTFLALMAYMVEGQQTSLIVAGVMLLGVLGHFPTLGRVEGWAEDQLRLLEEYRLDPFNRDA